MSYHDNVDWDKLSNQALEKAVMKSLELSMEGVFPLEDSALATRILYDHYFEEIWFMGPVPMKKGYEPPTINLSFL